MVDVSSVIGKEVFLLVSVFHYFCLRNPGIIVTLLLSVVNRNFYDDQEF